MPLDFPNDPAVGDIFAGAGARWLWDGAKWTSLMTSGGPFLPLAGGALTGPLMLAADPAVALHAATKQYVDAGGSGYLPLTGGELSGPLMLAAVSTATPPAGVGLLQGHAVNGTVIQGSGSATDFLLNNKNGAAVVWVPTGSTGADLNTIASKSSAARALTTRLGEVVNVRDYGAKGDGATIDTAAIQAAFDASQPAGGRVHFPPGNYVVNSPIALSSNTTVTGCGTSSVITTAATWVDPGIYGPDPYIIFVNKNYAVSPAVDTNILIDNLAFAWTNVAGAAASHNIRMYSAKSIKVRNCTFTGGGDAIAFVSVTDGLMQGNTAHGQTNCPYDVWGSSQKIRVIGNYAEGPFSQSANFNAAISGTGPQAASGYICANNHFINTGSGSGSINFDPLGTGNSVTNVQIIGNTLSGCQIHGRGNVSNVVVSGNILDAMAATVQAIFFSPDASSDTPANINVHGNTVLNPSTTSPNVGVFDLRANGFTADTNFISGNAFTTAAIYSSTYAGVVGPSNHAPGAATFLSGSAASTQNTFLVPNAKPVGFLDTLGGAVLLRVDGGNNFSMLGTDNTGAQTTILQFVTHVVPGSFAICPSVVTFGRTSPNFIRTTGGTAGNPPTIQVDPNSADTNAGIRLLGKGTSGAYLGSFSAAADPTTANVPTGQWVLWHNTTTPSTKLWFNNAGTMQSAALT